jgi:stage V sporulation protein B
MGTSKKSNNFLVQGSILAAASILSRLIGMLYRIPLTNIIGDEGNGYYSNAYSIYGIALILSSYSLPLAVSKLVSARVIKKEYRNSYRVFLCAMLFAVATCLLTTLVIFFGADFFATTIYNDPRSALPLKIISPTIFIFGIMGILRGYFQGKNTMLPTSVSQILEQVINAIVSISAAYFFMKAHSASEDIAAYGAAGSALGTIMGALVSFAFLVFIFILYKPIINKQLRKDTSGSRESYSEVFRILIATIIPVIFSQLIFQLSSVIDGSLFGHIMASNGTPYEIRSSLYGIYMSKYKLLIDLPVSIASAMAVAFVPSIVASKASGSNTEVKTKVHLAIKFNMIIAIPAAVGIGVLAKPILDILFVGDNALPARLVQIGCAAVIFFALSTTSNAILQGINKMQVPVINAAISLFIHIILVVVLLKFFNLSTYALVIGNVTFALLICVLNWLSVGKYLSYKQEVIKTFLIPTGCSILMGIVAFLSYYGINQLIHSNLISTAISVVLSVIVYGSTLLIFKGVTREELYDMPLGRTIARFADKLHLL